MYHIKPIIALEPFGIVTHSYAASFSIETPFMKLKTFLSQKLRRFTQNL